MTDKSNKLIKIADELFVIINDSEKLNCKDWFIDINTKIVGQYFHGPRAATWKKITHSTEPMEVGVAIGFESSNCFDKIKPLTLSEVEEAIYGYSVEKIFQESHKNTSWGNVNKYSYQKEFELGFKAHKELTKDKLFTLEDMDQAYERGLNDAGQPVRAKKMIEAYLKSLQPKTEWDVEFDENDKMLIKC